MALSGRLVDAEEEPPSVLKQTVSSQANSAQHGDVRTVLAEQSDMGECPCVEG